MVLYLSRHIKLCVCVWQKRLFIFHWRNFFGPHFERFWTFLTESSPFIGKLKWSFIFMLWKYCGRMWNAGNEKNAFKSNGEVLSHDCHFNGAIRKSYLKTQTSTPPKRIPIERETKRESDMDQRMKICNLHDNSLAIKIACLFFHMVHEFKLVFHATESFFFFVETLIGNAWNGWFSVCVCLRSHSHGSVGPNSKLDFFFFIFLVDPSFKPKSIFSIAHNVCVQ